jgi:hypothetical protein
LLREINAYAWSGLRHLDQRRMPTWPVFWHSPTGS